MKRIIIIFLIILSTFFGTRFLLLYEWAANYALWPEGYGGRKSRQAATQFIKDMGYTLHAATMEAGGVGA